MDQITGHAPLTLLCERYGQLAIRFDANIRLLHAM